MDLLWHPHVSLFYIGPGRDSVAHLALFQSLRKWYGCRSERTNLWEPYFRGFQGALPIPLLHSLPNQTNFENSIRLKPRLTFLQTSRLPLQQQVPGLHLVQRARKGCRCPSLFNRLVGYLRCRCRWSDGSCHVVIVAAELP